MITTYVTLTDDELVLLDGKVAPAIQAKIDEAKARTTAAKGKDNPALWHLLADIKTAAEQSGELRYRCRHHNGKCRICGKGGGYHPYPRNGRHHRKGEPNYKRPKLIGMIDLDPSCVTINNRVYLGCCTQCWQEHRDTIMTELRQLKAELPRQLLSNGEQPTYRRYYKYKCRQCDWEGHEGEMGRLPCMMGNGTYPGQCPKCGGKNLPIAGGPLDLQPGHVVIATQ